MKGVWSNFRDLQGYLSGKKYYGKRADKPLSMPYAGYILRACIARALPDPDNHGNVDTHAVRKGIHRC